MRYLLSIITCFVAVTAFSCSDMVQRGLEAVRVNNKIGPPGNLRIVTATKSNINVSWNDPTSIQFISKSIKIFVSTAKADLNSLSVPYVEIDSSSTSYEIIGLDPDTTYYINVTAVDINGIESKRSNMVWATTDEYFYRGFGSTGNVVIVTGCPSEDGGYILGGSYFIDGMEKPFAMKVDDNGVKVWQKVYSGHGEGVIHSITSAPSGGFYLGARTQKTSSGIALLKINNFGEMIFTKNVAVNMPDGYFTSYTLSQYKLLNNGSGLTIACKSRNLNLNYIKIVELNQDCDMVLNSKVYGIADKDFNYNDFSIIDNYYIICGRISNTKAFIMKLDRIDLSVVWNREISIEGFNSENYRIQRMMCSVSSDGYAISVNTNKMDPNTGFFLHNAHLNESGSIAWQNSISFSWEVFPCSIITTGENTMVVGTISEGQVYNSNYGFYLGTPFVLTYDNQGNVRSKYLYTRHNIYHQVKDSGMFLTGMSRSGNIFTVTGLAMNAPGPLYDSVLMRMNSHGNIPEAENFQPDQSYLLSEIGLYSVLIDNSSDVSIQDAVTVLESLVNPVVQDVVVDTVEYHD